MISSFFGQYRFLSNFYPASVVLDGETFPTVEHAYQAAKCIDVQSRDAIRLAAGPVIAKRMGRRVKVRPDWDVVRLDVMRSLLKQKFAPDTECSRLLLSTGDEMLVEGNYWNDTFWGVCNGEGKNWLGVLLMEIRDELRANSSS